LALIDHLISAPTEATFKQQLAYWNGIGYGKPVAKPGNSCTFYLMGFSPLNKNDNQVATLAR